MRLTGVNISRLWGQTVASYKVMNHGDSRQPIVLMNYILKLSMIAEDADKIKMERLVGLGP